MATVSSHILDSVSGTHAGGIRVELFRLHDDGGKELVFDAIASDEGRITETVDATVFNSTTEYELIFHTADYFASRPNTASAIPVNTKQVLDVVVVRMTMDDAEARYHIPLVLSPHSYTIWWSG
ncbi:MAG: hydroxyisourate hydrolase [Gammaproteobacteria bacterium]|nr:hydroxyisourate hydrolase [Gammaproteobacteria bacterium]